MLMSLIVTEALSKLYKRGGFVLRNFISNSKRVKGALEDPNEPQHLVSMNQPYTGTDKILYIFRDTINDNLTF